MNHGARKLNGARSAFFGKRRHGGAARVGKPEKLRRLVEGFARGVVERFAEEFVVPEALHLQNLRVPARDEHGKEGEFGGGVRKARRKEVPFEVVHAENGNLKRPADRVRDGVADEQSACEPRPFGDGHGVDVGAGLPRLIKYVVDERHGATDVVAARELGHHAAVGAVHVDLGVQSVGEKTVSVGNECSSRLVAGGFDTKYEHSAEILLVRTSGRCFPEGFFHGGVFGARKGKRRKPRAAFAPKDEKNRLRAL